MKYQSTKTYGHEIGLSCAFRQWRANSHCNKLHGYALSFKFIFEADELDQRGWVIDFGNLKPLKKMLQDQYDHKTVVARDDPNLGGFEAAHKWGILDLRRVDAVGCEAFAEDALQSAKAFLSTIGQGHRVRIVSVEVSEHGANSALAIA